VNPEHEKQQILNLTQLHFYLKLHFSVYISTTIRLRNTIIRRQVYLQHVVCGIPVLQYSVLQ